MAGLKIACYGLVDREAGSIAASHHRLLEGLIGRGHDVDLLATEGYVRDPRIPGVAFRPMQLRQPRWYRMLGRLGNRRIDQLRGQYATLLAASCVRDLVNDPGRRYDVVLVLGIAGVPSGLRPPVVSWPQGLPGGELMVLRRRRKLIVSISGWSSYAPIRLFYELREVLRSSGTAAWTVVASEASRRELVARGHPAERVTSIPYSVDLDRFHPRRSPPNATASQRSVLCVGRLDPRKRVDLLVDAVALLAARRQDFHVQVIGRPGYLPGWRERVERASEALPISYAPAIPSGEVAARLAACDLLVQPSEVEEFGHAVAEALSSGVPVVVGPTNRTREYVDPTTGSCFTDYRAEPLAEAIEQWLDTPTGQTPAACRASAERHFSPEVVAEAVEAVVLRAATAPRDLAASRSALQRVTRRGSAPLRRLAESAADLVASRRRRVG